MSNLAYLFLFFAHFFSDLWCDALYHKHPLAFPSVLNISYWPIISPSGGLLFIITTDSTNMIFYNQKWTAATTADPSENPVHQFGTD